MRPVFAVVLLVTAAAMGAAVSARTDAAAPPKPAVLLTSDYAPETLRACEPVTWRLRVANRSPRGAVLRFRSGQRGEVVLRRRNGSLAYRWSDTRGFALALWSRTLSARGTWSIELPDRLRVAPGRYLMVARITGRSSLAARLVARRWVTVDDGREMCAAAAGDQLPPAASAITAAREVTLATGSFCWQMCADIATVSGFLEGLPSLVVQPGDVVRFRLRIDPTEVTVAYGPLGTATTPTPLPAIREPTWVVPYGFLAPPPGVLLSLFVRGSVGASQGAVTYHAALRSHV